MICPECQKENNKSFVYPKGRVSTAMYCQPYYDENGVYHFHDLNRHTFQYSCSNGHLWAKVSKNKCHCGWEAQ